MVGHAQGAGWDTSQMSELVQSMILTAFGVILGVGVTALERLRARREADRRRSAAWALAYVGDGRWTMTNVGDAKARDIELRAEPGEVVPLLPRPFHLAPGEAELVEVSPAFPWRTQLVVQWTSERGERMGPVRRILPF